MTEEEINERPDEEDSDKEPQETGDQPISARNRRRQEMRDAASSEEED